MIAILTWISIISGGILLLLLLLSLIGGMDFDFDLGDTDVDAGGGGIGIVKGVLTFVSSSTWVIKLVIAIEDNPVKAFGIGIGVGLMAVFILHMILKLLMKQQVNVNWSANDAIFKEGKVYLRIPGEGQGIIKVNINGAIRELKAASQEKTEIPTGAQITVHEVIDNIAYVSKV